MEQQIEQKIKDMFPQLLKDNLMSFSNLVVPPHRHNAVDSPQIASSTLLPYTLTTSTQNSIPFISSKAIPGSIALFDFSTNEPTPGNFFNWGMDIFLGNDNGQYTFSELNLADFWLDAIQLTPQTIGANSTATIIYDNDQNITKPTGAYNTATGLFSVVNNTKGQPQTYGGWNQPGWYLVTTSVALTPNTSGLGDYATINIVVDGTVVVSNRCYYIYTTLPVIATISALINTNITSNIKITVENHSAVSVSTNITNISKYNYFKIKQLK